MRLLNNSDTKRFMVATNQKSLDIFNAVLEIHHFNRDDIINQLIKRWIYENSEPDLHDHINNALSPARNN